ncbi:OLC1v1011507C1 [Oldenlandia corymbosa var. corymbosa]|uniref:procollagen-proline 4-dioxygenase n=1 Tax=Oldenlandia corymbosa var. corymbosa TaxID=529605 RepID=A0AAV1DTT8_OLDCO|nr:OLC1v1011507C1 [Oldenlandia corymbosa var. corymbosa]
MKNFRGGKIVGNGGRWQSLGLPFVFLLCISFFLAGFFGSALFSQPDEWSMQPRPKPRVLESVAEKSTAPEEDRRFDPLAHGKSGEGFLTSIPFQVLSLNPRALYFPNFATAEQCQSIIKMAKVELRPSSLALREGETEESTKGIRTSSGMFISSYEDKTGTLARIEEKISKATMIPKSHGEPFNVLRYEIGQRYQSHYDAFSPSEYGPQKSQRVASFLLYLSDVEEGGETMFPFEGGVNMDSNYDYSKCIGLKVKPRRGDGLLFYSLFPNGTIDPTSLHGSCPVIKGQKWVATKWIRDQEQEDYYPKSN